MTEKLIMGLYTFFLDYKGGTYVWQGRARSFRDAPRVWAEHGLLDGPKIGIASRRQVLSAILDETPAEVNGMINTWCITFIIKNELALVHYTRTLDNRPNRRDTDD